MILNRRKVFQAAAAVALSPKLIESLPVQASPRTTITIQRRYDDLPFPRYLLGGGWYVEMERSLGPYMRGTVKNIYYPAQEERMWVSGREAYSSEFKGGLFDKFLWVTSQSAIDREIELRGDFWEATDDPIGLAKIVDIDNTYLYNQGRILKGGSLEQMEPNTYMGGWRRYLPSDHPESLFHTRFVAENYPSLV